MSIEAAVAIIVIAVAATGFLTWWGVVSVIADLDRQRRARFDRDWDRFIAKIEKGE